MDIQQVVKELQDERDRIVAAIDSLQRLAAGQWWEAPRPTSAVDAGR